MRILQITPEARPWAKTGGLADVAGALTDRLARRGHEVTLAIPLYRTVREDGHADAPIVWRPGAEGPDLPVPVVVRELAAGSPGPRVLAVDAPDLFDREGLYGDTYGDYSDNLLRFSVFVRAALAAAGPSRPDVVHAHDWQAALAPVYVRAGLAVGTDSRPALILTLHNLAYQGQFPADRWADTGLPPEWFRADRLESFGRIHLLKGGILAADRVTTVSPGYAREIGTPALGFGLDGLLAGLPHPVEGILNGIDTEEWDPARDPHLPAPFEPADLGGKAAAKAALQAEFGLPEIPDVPLFGLVSRLVEQKGLGLIEAVRGRLGDWPAQFVLLGTGEPRFEALLRDLAASLPNVGARVAFSERLAHLVEAGSDFFLMPSAFEPCGLNQMISQRYGTIPVVHGVGGLADTVVDVSPEALAEGSATGIVFRHFDAPALCWAIDTAIEIHADPVRLDALRQAGMRTDFSWERSGRRYEELYERTLADRRAERDD
ncbi:MAG: glycogen synthase GlgA [Gemmatimonadota bacterium]|nr:glycogen synthase GlgA [Gemmatimonadota bacterium]